VALDRIANKVGDGHTYVRLPPDYANFPLDFGRFGKDCRVTAVAPGLERALGSRVVRVQDTPMDRAREILLTLTPQGETSWLRDSQVDGSLTAGMLLHGCRIIPDREQARFTFAEDAGREFSLDVQALRSEEKPKWTWVFKDQPLYRQHPGESLWQTYIADRKTVYCNFRGYQALGRKSRELFRLVQENQPEKLIIDLRQNGGGDYTVGLQYLVRPIKNLAAINKKGHLFVLIGTNTFSAAMSNAAHFRYQTEALLVGQPIGERPNSYQEAREMKLPNSRLAVRYSIKFYKFVESGENVIRPDHEIVPTWEDFKSGKDPVLDWVLQYEMK
jgi:hypothetical protein